MRSPTDGVLWFVVELDIRNGDAVRHGWVRSTGHSYQGAVQVSLSYFDAYVFSAEQGAELYPWRGRSLPRRGERVDCDGCSCWPSVTAAADAIDQLAAEILGES